MKRVSLVLVAFAIVLAACGGGEDQPAETTAAAPPAAADDGTDADAPTDSTPQPTQPPAAATEDSDTSDDPDPGSGQTTEFCGFIAGIDEAQDNIDAGLDPVAFQTAMEESLRGIRRARDLAPPEVESDVQLILDAFLSFVELFEEYEWNLIAIGTNAADDPRLLAFDEVEFEAAGDRIGTFCGLDLDSGDDVEETFTDITGIPTALVPPGVTETFDMGNGSFALSTTMVFAEAVAFYIDAIGPPVFADEDQKLALWKADVDGKSVTVSLAEVANKVEVILAIAG